MRIAEMIPTLDNAALGNLRENALRLQAGGAGPKRHEAEALLPLIDAELAQRQAKKPAPARARKPSAARKK